ncbi:hypothetical protein [Streptomyces sp. NPDC001404]|uniref:hypothetical protein n=1 Tax=Streptomyces sp. NPDC001404 TaxID=3364571 RepID=UPI0036CED267
MAPPSGHLLTRRHGRWHAEDSSRAPIGVQPLPDETVRLGMTGIWSNGEPVSRFRPADLDPSAVLPGQPWRPLDGLRPAREPHRPWLHSSPAPALRSC